MSRADFYYPFSVKTPTLCGANSRTYSTLVDPYLILSWHEWNFRRKQGLHATFKSDFQSCSKRNDLIIVLVKSENSHIYQDLTLLGKICARGLETALRNRKSGNYAKICLGRLEIRYLKQHQKYDRLNLKTSNFT